MQFNSKNLKNHIFIIFSISRAKESLTYTGLFAVTFMVKVNFWNL